MKSSAAIRATGRASAAARISESHPWPRCCRRCRASPLPCSGTPPSDCRPMRRRWAASRARKSTLCSPRLGKAGYDYLWFYRQHWREDLESAGAAALAGSQYRSGGRTPDQGRSNQHGAFSGGAAAAAGSSLGRVHAERGPRAAGGRQRRRGKLLVRKLMEPRLPPGHLNRPKSGFGLPVHRWLKRTRRFCAMRCGA
jgi:hypothetical protein